MRVVQMGVLVLSLLLAALTATPLLRSSVASCAALGLSLALAANLVEDRYPMLTVWLRLGSLVAALVAMVKWRRDERERTRGAR